MAEQKMTPEQYNAYARALIKVRAVPMLQQIFSQSFSAGAGVNISSVQPVVTVQPRMVGLVKGFWVKVTLTVSNGSAVQINRTDFGPLNALSQIQFNDLQNNQRIQTTGWHIGMIDAIKGRRPFGTSMVASTGISPVGGYGDNFAQQIQAPATIAAAGSGTVIMWYYVPLAYSDDDLRGAIFASVVNATMQMNLTFNAVPVVANGADSTAALYVGNAAGAVTAAVISAATITVYQSYLDQLPMGPQGAVLPIVDLATIYELKNTQVTAITANQDFPIQYSNFRSFLSTIAVFVNTAATGARTGGTDVNTWALTSANFTNLWKCEPGLIALRTRQHLGTDMPTGVYYFGSREKPISTIQYGNMELVLNASTAGTGAYVLLGYEDFALVQQVSNAGSLPAA